MQLRGLDQARQHGRDRRDADRRAALRGGFQRWRGADGQRRGEQRKGGLAAVGGEVPTTGARRPGVAHRDHPYAVQADGCGERAEPVSSAKRRFWIRREFTLVPARPPLIEGAPLCSLFYGPPGTGKTSTMLACARQLYGKSISSMVLELNASDARGINVVRTEIQNFASTRLMFNKGTKLVILDECDGAALGHVVLERYRCSSLSCCASAVCVLSAMTNDAQFALRRVIEKYVKNVRFCLIW
eukprot:SAG31_NODE_1245_length_9134_cov_6.012064_7_plen_243_part_00